MFATYFFDLFRLSFDLFRFRVRFRSVWTGLDMSKKNYSRRWLLNFMLYKISQDNVLILALRPNSLLTNLYKECEGPWV